MLHLRRTTTLIRCSIPILALFFCACASPPESSKSLVKITNVTLSRLDTQTLRVTLYYDLESGVTLPLSYKTVVVTPLEPSVEIAGALSEFVLSNDSVAVDLDIPAEAGIDGQALYRTSFTFLQQHFLEKCLSNRESCGNFGNRVCALFIRAHNTFL